MSQHRPFLFGPGERWAALAALCYAGTNLLLRASVVSTDPLIATILRLVPTTAFAWGLTLSTQRTGYLNPRASQFAGWKVLLALGLGGIASYFAGNNAYQLALRAGGINVTVPIAQSASLWSGILLGATFLGERFERNVVWGGLAVGAGLLLLTNDPNARLPLDWVTAVPLAALAGVGYAASNTMMRFAFRRGMTQFPALAVNTTSGLVLLLTTGVLRDGLNLFSRTPPQTALALLVAGVFNSGALFSLSRALTLTTSSRVNSINTGTIAISTLLASVLFHESLTPLIAGGIALVIGGILFVQRYLAPPRPQPVSPPEVPPGSGPP